MISPRTRRIVIIAGLALSLSLLSVAASARSWSAVELEAEGKDDWIWSDKKFGESVREQVLQYDDVDEPPAMEKRVYAKYPDGARTKYIVHEGDVLVGVVVDSRGKVIHARVVEDSGTDFGFEEKAIEAARRTRWHPGVSSDQRVPVYLLQEFLFRSATTRWGEPISKIAKWHYRVDLDPVFKTDTIEVSPSQDDFVVVEEQPAEKKKIQPKYPRSAVERGIEGTVWVKVLVDPSGRVREATILQESGTNAGLEEAALSAAIDGEWKPAKISGKPILIWVAYEVKFRIKR